MTTEPKPGEIWFAEAVNVQGLASFDQRKLTRRMGELGSAQMAEVRNALRDLLGL